MHALDKSLRNILESTVIEAREVAEEAAKIVLEQLGVEQSAPYPYLTEEQRELRRKLRAHGRQLGDIRDPKDETQEIEGLIEEVAYEHWHRMLFARFLAENQLLMFYEDDDIDNAVAVTLEECDEMADEMGCVNGWELASKLAAKMLPQIFRPESPVYMLHFSPEKQRELEILLAELSSEVFTASDSLGWVYQFWQAKKKREVNEAGNKIGSRELPAVTQLFTESYMVSFLLDNSLGAWWAKRRLTKDILKSATNEEELRNKVRLEGAPLEYLRFVKGEDEYWAPAGGEVEGWPEKLSELKALDPCCGSGHFLVSAFLMLVPMRMELEGLSAKEACDAVLRENIHGLEIDQRCVELAAFAVALTAWKYPGAGGFRQLPDLQIAWCGQSVNVKKEDWLALAEDETDLRIHLEVIYNLFQYAPILGSLINPINSFKEGSIFAKDWDKVRMVIQARIDKKKMDEDGLGIVAQGMLNAFQMLGDKYHWIVTNVPYLVRGKHSNSIKEHLEKDYSNGKHDIAYAFLQRIVSLLVREGNASIVIPENWLYITPCLDLRDNILEHTTIEYTVRLGPGAFHTISGEVVKALLFSLTTKSPNSNHSFWGIESCLSGGIESKMGKLRDGELKYSLQDEQKHNPDHRISLSKIDTGDLLSKYSEGLHGQGTFDKSCFVLQFWEIPNLTEVWELQQSTPTRRSMNDYGASQIFRWEKGSGLLYKTIQDKKEHGYSSGKWKAGVNIWGEVGVCVSGIGYLYIRKYLGKAFDENVAVIHPYDSKNLNSIYEYIKSDVFLQNLKVIDNNLKASCNTLVKVPFDLNYWQQISFEKKSNIILKPYSDDPTQWIFHGYPGQSESPLQVAVARLLGYRWPAELVENIELSDEARELVKKCNGLSPYTDKNGIVCIPPVRGEASATERLLNLLAAAYKDQDINAKLSELLAACDHAGKSLESWLRNKFFVQHFKLFGHRPFIWHIWDGLSDGFAALVNYHKLDRRNLETLIYTYLGDWINKQKAEIAAGVDGAQEKLAAAENLKKNLELILEGEAPYDIFVRWKSISNQPIGWEPDINDGVRLNIRPFMSVPDVGKKGAGILRDKPNIKWEKDRGKDTASSPWYHIFTGDRINDYHITLDEKKRAREEKRQARL